MTTGLARIGTFGLLALVAASHGALARSAPGAMRVVAPPLSCRFPGSAACAGLGDRALWAELSARVAQPGATLATLLEFVEVSSRLRAESAGLSVLRAVAQRSPSGRISAAIDELSRAPAEGPWDEGAASGPLQAHLRLRRAVARVRERGAAGLLPVLGGLPLHLGAAEIRELPRSTRWRLVRIIGLADPEAAGRRAWELWREAKRRGDATSQRRALATIAAVRRQRAEAVALAERALQLAKAAGDLQDAYTAVAFLQDADGSRTRIATPSCLALAPGERALRADCRVQAFLGAWAQGQVPAMLAAYRPLGGTLAAASSDVLTLKAARAVLPFLASSGLEDDYLRWHALAIASAERMGALEARDELWIGLAAFDRRAGRLAEAESDLARVRLDGVGDPVALWVERARLAGAGGDAPASREALSRAFRALETARDPSLMRAQVLLAALELDPDIVSSASARWLTRNGAVPPLAQSIWRSLVQGRLAEARADWDLAISLYAASRIQGTASPRNGVPEDWPPLEDRIDELVLARVAAAELQRGRPLAALEALEASREPASRTAGSWGHVLRHLEPRDRVLVFGVLDEQLWVWSLGAASQEALRLDVELRDVFETAALWVDLLRSDRSADSWGPVADRLGALLLGRLVRRGWLEGVERVFIVAQPGIDEVPFDMLPLPGRRAGEGVAEARPVFVSAPSLGILDEAWHRVPSRQTAVAFVPRTSRDAIAEARMVESALRAQLYLGVRATEESFRRALAGARFVHFGGHAEPPRSPLDSGGLAFRPAGLSDGVLEYSEIVAARIDGATVILMGCDTAGRGRRILHPAMGPPTLAQAFLQAGSRAVIGNLWAISDADARVLAEAYYAAGGPEAGPAAIRRTKAIMRERFPGQPSRWAGLVWQGAPPA